MQKLPRMSFAMQMSKNSDNVYEIYLYDDITEYGDFNWETWSRDESETSAKHFQKMLSDIPDTAEIELYINSNGGSVKEGVSIYNQLKRHGAHKTGYVDGVAHSVAFVILQACDHRVMGEGTSALIHEMWVCTCGNARQLREEADQLDVLMQGNRALFMQRAQNITEDELRELMEKETMLTPDMALQYGFIDEIAGREAELPTVDETGVVNQLRKQLRNEDFSKELEVFTELVKPAEPDKKTGEPKEASMMDTFFNIFS